MINKPANYDTAPTYGTGDFETVMPGGHICIIKSARAENDRNGNQMLVIAFDFAQEDAQAGFYQRDYETRVVGNVDAKWQGVYRQGIVGKSTPFFKGMITSIEKSNPGYVWNWDEATLKGKKFGGVFGREQYKGTDGQPRWSCKCQSIRSTENVLSEPAPEDKYLPGHSAQTETAAAVQGYAGMSAAPAEDDLPF